MKRLLSLLAVLMFSVFTFTSCEDPMEPCERDNVGTVVIENDFKSYDGTEGYHGEFDVTWGNSNTNDERVVYFGNTTTYRNVPGGKIYVWASCHLVGPDFNYWTDWASDDYYLDACETFNYRWYLKYGKKSTGGELALDITRNGELVETITDFEFRVKE